MTFSKPSPFWKDDNQEDWKRRSFFVHGQKLIFSSSIYFRNSHINRAVFTFFNQVSSPAPLLYPLKTEKLWFSGVFRGYRSESLVENALMFSLGLIRNRHELGKIHINLLIVFLTLLAVISNEVLQNWSLLLQG